MLISSCYLLFTESWLVQAQNGDQASSDDGCTAADTAPTPVAVEFDSVPISVDSTEEDYFVLYAQHGQADDEIELPVAVVKGQDGTTNLSERITALTADRYRIEKYAIATPADVDGDCVDDITELDDPANHSPVNSAPRINSVDGSTIIANPEAFNALDGGAGIRFIATNNNTNTPGVYYINARTHNFHESFFLLDSVNVTRKEVRYGHLFYLPDKVAPNGETGYFFFSLRGFDNSVDEVKRIYSLLAANLHSVNNNLYFHIANFDLPIYQEQLKQLRDSRVNLIFDDYVYPREDFTIMNQAEAYGRLRALDPDDRPHPHDIVIYDQLPNELSQVAGIITTTPQTPLAHVNLRAAQNGIPNAFINEVRTEIDFDALIDNYVYYQTTETGWTLRAATPAEVNAHYAALVSPTIQTPTRDLSVTTIKPLTQIGFNDWTSFGVKAANVAVLGQLGFPSGTVPEGYAIPFYFYDEFMKANDFYDEIEEMLEDEDFQDDYDEQASKLKKLRKKIKDATTPQWIIDALETMHNTYPEGQKLRYRSSTNNEDLPSFNGAGLYDSQTQKPSETEKDGIDKSLKQVFASLWNFRAFSERELHNVDHSKTAMGVLVHPNYTDELANGVAVSFDALYGRSGRYYFNTQLGEDLVTNPPANSIPEEMLVTSSGEATVLNVSNLVPTGQLLLSAEQTTQLAQHLTVIHNHFKTLYNPAANKPFAIEVEFKITSEDILAIKQARTWVFGPNQTITSLQPVPQPQQPEPTPQPQPEPISRQPQSHIETPEPEQPIEEVEQEQPEPEPEPEPIQQPEEPEEPEEIPVSSPTPAELANQAAEQFEDVSIDDYYSTPVGWLLENEITTGCDLTKFCPEEQVSRQQFITFLWRAAGSPTPSQLGSEIFADVVDASYANNAIGWAADQAITNGCGLTAGGESRRFCPHQLITRAQIATFLYRYVGATAEPSADFEDVDSDAYYARSVAWMSNYGITSGCNLTSFCPNRLATRAQAAAFLYRTANTPESWGEDNLGILRSPDPES